VNIRDLNVFKPGNLIILTSQFPNRTIDGYLYHYFLNQNKISKAKIYFFDFAAPTYVVNLNSFSQYTDIFKEFPNG